ncbi:MAG: AAA family ATPase [Myxococcota bacterium]
MASADTPSLTLLHLSDLHFGQDRGDATARFDQKLVTRALLEDVKGLVNEGLKPDYIVLTGDVAFSAQPEEYEAASAWLGELCGECGLKTSRLLMVPGNHDVDRKKVSGDFLPQITHQNLRSTPAKLDELLTPKNVNQLEMSLWPKLQAYASFATSLEAPSITAEHPFWQAELTTPFGKPVVALGLNTCLLSFDGADAPSNLALGLGQLHRAFEKLPQDALVLALLHHPPEWLLDGAPGLSCRPEHALTTFLQKYAHVLLVGHVHQQGGLLSHPLHTGGLLRFVAGAGHEAAHEGGKHAYAWVRLHAQGIDFFPRMWNADRQRFQPEANRFELEKGQQYTRLKRSKLADKLEKWLEPRPDYPATEELAAPPPPRPASRLLMDRLQPTELVVVLDGFGTLKALVERCQAQGSTVLYQSPDAPLIQCVQQLQTTPASPALWKTLTQHFTSLIDAILREAKSRVHLVVQLPGYAPAMLLARLLDQKARVIPVHYYQFDHLQGEWLLMWDPMTKPSSEPYFLQPTPQVSASEKFDDIALSIEFRALKEEELRALQRRWEPLAVYALRRHGGHIVDLQDAATAYAEITQMLETIRAKLAPSGRLHLLTSAPLALMMAVAAPLRETVFEQVLIHQYSPHTGYAPVLELMNARAYVEEVYYLSKVELSALRRFGTSQFELPARPGWYVLAGPNGSGKSTLLQSLAYALSGKELADAVQSTLPNGGVGWLQQGQVQGQEKGYIRTTLRSPSTAVTCRLDWKQLGGRLESTETLSGLPDRPRAHAAGIQRRRFYEQLFLAAYGPFRRLSGHSDEIQQMMRAPSGRILGLFREEISLADGVEWLKDQDYRKKKDIVEQSLNLLNDGLLPEPSDGDASAEDRGQTIGARGKMRILNVNADGLLVERSFSNGDTTRFTLQSLSDGYRAVIALVLDLVSRMVQHGRMYWPERTLFEPSSEAGVSIRIRCPGIVLIDEVDAHLHLEWQRRIGFWLKTHFPDVQFVVTTHSPYICQAAEQDGLFRLPSPSETNAAVVRIENNEVYNILSGEADDAAVSSLFGLPYTHSEQTEILLEEVAKLSSRVSRRTATLEEREKLRTLAQSMPHARRLELESLVSRAERLS